MKKHIPLILFLALGVNASLRGEVPVLPVTITVTDAAKVPDLPDRFLGLSYEMSMLLPKDGGYYFDPKNQALIQIFQTLGIKSLRVGANAVDDPRIAVPQEKDIDVFFNFARAAGVKVIYSFRLKDGDPAEAARLAGYISAHDNDVLDCFAIGNEPNFYLKKYPDFFTQWKSRYDAILQAVPEAKFDGPSALGKDEFVTDLVKDLSPGGTLVDGQQSLLFSGLRAEGRKRSVSHPGAFSVG